MAGGSIYRSDGAKRELEDHYRRGVDRLERIGDVDVDSKWVETRYGRTHLLVAGPEDALPVVVFHGGNVTNPVSLEWFLPLAGQYRLYAPDTIGHPGLSAETRLSPADDSYGKWVVDILDELGLESAPMIGPSYGGGIVLRTAAYAPNRIDAAALYAPAGLATGSAWRLLSEIVVPMLWYRLAPSRTRLERAIQPMFTDSTDELDDDLVEQIGAVFRGVKLEREFPARASAAELRAFDAPTLLVLAEDDLFFPPRAVGPRAREVIPNLVSDVLLRGEAHFPSPTGRTKLVERIREFLDEYGDS
ncbi:alpha/beta fold hydrolase [Halobacteria archaeon AArc-m2/3/4]|uniref:Alpha/beta fold hydrolase n=1 Tax=Natronoglomus mannanivorans TaxID=2979990 RepID=A0ABT2QI13_9EURY|nr:alpha/beta fold hydrolase [Halobacteria archaeon AArc-m2/3/4]